MFSSLRENWRNRRLPPPFPPPLAGEGREGVNSRKIARDMPITGLHIHSSIPFILPSIKQSIDQEYAQLKLVGAAMQRSKSRHAAAFGGNIRRISCTAVTLQMKQRD